MTIEIIMQIIGTYGFPILMCGALAWYVKYTDDKHSQEMESIRKEHRQEMKEVTQALNNNTNAITRLCDKLEKEGVFNDK